MPTVIKENHVTDWVAGLIVPIVQHVSGSVLALALVMFVAMILLRFTDPTGFLVMTVLFLAVSSLLLGHPAFRSGEPQYFTLPTGIIVGPIVLIAALLLAGHPMWALYENFWVALAHGMCNNQAFSNSHRVRLAYVYAIVSLFALTIAVGYWRIIGLWR